MGGLPVMAIGESFIGKGAEAVRLTTILGRYVSNGAAPPDPR